MTAARTVAIAFACAAGVTELTGCASWMSSDIRLHDDFRSYPVGWRGTDGDVFGPWRVIFAGYGTAEIARIQGRTALRLSTLGSATPAETHAALVVGPEFAGSYDVRVAMLTERQLRAPGAPNPWEVAWFVFQYTDAEHFYYFIPKPNGWELGKRDPAYPGGQRFLATGETPAYHVGAWCDLRLRVERPGHFVIWLDGIRVGAFDDAERPYALGRIGFYLEDASAAFTDLRLR